MSDISLYLPMWDQLTPAQQNELCAAAIPRAMAKGSSISSSPQDCTGLLLVQSGQLRAYILSEEGREVTLYRLFERDVCLLSASCMMSSIQFDVMIEAEKDTQLFVIPSGVYKQLMLESAPASNYISEVMASRFSEVMWLIEQIMWKSFDKRLAEFLLGEAALEGTSVLRTTHETIGNHLGSPREVVTRMLHYFQQEGMVSLSRGMIEITDPAKLQALCDK